MARTDRDPELEKSPDDVILDEARDRFKRVQDWESDFRIKYIEDVKFANGDSDNGWQWPQDLKKDRDVNQRPTLTINKTGPLCRLITNDARKNKPAVSVKPTGDQVTYKAAQVYEGLIRHIEYRSKAQSIYDDATESQVEGGIGYWRVTSDYVNDTSFDQEIIISPVKDHLGVYLDCDIKQKDGSDAKYGFIFEELPQEEFKREYSNVDLPPAGATTLNEMDTWITRDNVRVAEYYRIVETKDELIWFQDEQGQESTFNRSDIPPPLKKAVEKAIDDNANTVKRRPIKRRQLEWYKIAGNEIVDRRKLKGKFIPIVRLVGRERVIEGKLERKGHVRPLKDAQRIYNYNSSANVEFGALQTKTPWVGPAAAFDGNEVAWQNANRSNAAFLTYKHVDEDSNPIPPPNRPEPPSPSPAFMEGLRIAAAEMDMASGQYTPQQQNPLLERTPKAIAERQRTADTSTYHFVDHLALAIRYTGMIILDLAPHIYDTERVIKILGKDGTISEVAIVPDAQEAYKEQQKDQQEIKVLFNPKIGEYGIEADVGPAYATQRQEAWNAFVEITTKNPELIAQVGDLMFQSADFPLADKISERLKRNIKTNMPWLLDDNAPNPMVAELQQQVANGQQQVAELLQKLSESQIKLKGKEEMRDIDVYDAHTRRITAISNAEPELGGSAIKDVVRQTLAEMLGFKLDDVIEANKPSLDMAEHGGSGGGVGEG